MLTANTGNMAIAFNEEGINSAGSLTPSLKRPNEMTAARARAVQSILSMASTKGEPVGVVVNKVLSQSIPELQSFVQARGEAPSDNPVDLAVQAALLRATEIAVVSKSVDTTDNDALLMIEDSEQQHVEDNTGETSSILSPDTSAALTLLVKRISDRFKAKTGSDSLCDFIYALRLSTGADSFTEISLAKAANGFYGVYGAGDTSSTTATSSDSGSFWDDLFNNMDKIVDGVTKVSGAINTAAGSVNTTSGTIVDKINQIGGGVGAASIDQYLQANWLKVVGVILAIIVITIIAARAVRN